MQKQLLFFLCGIALVALTSCGGSDPEPTNPPSSLVYTPNNYNVSAGTAGSSSAPTVSGDTPMTFSLVGNSESAISINSSTGVISSTTSLAAGTYRLNVNVSNGSGDQTFNNAFTVVASLPDAPPSGLSYPISTLVVRKHETLTSAPPTLSSGSTPLTFEISNANLIPSQITIGTGSGVIMVAKGLAHGSYQLNIKVSNSFGESSLTNAITVVSQAVTFSGGNGIVNLVQNKCTPCHVSGGTRPNWTVYSNAANNVDNIISRVVSGSMPQGGTPLSQGEIDLIKQWKADGLAQ